ncbi:hypothetical protein [Alicyclobacillus sp. SP_1]|uniref:hypothetical protein n=1 Tax=Alicyclobacillus sp. SP_1 TaxID=2942475 RepID=UPI0021578555|nr:hypothetical protein [Alicyclobacillus sp. SP_1]
MGFLVIFILAVVVVGTLLIFINMRALPKEDSHSGSPPPSTSTVLPGPEGARGEAVSRVEDSRHGSVTHITEEIVDRAETGHSTRPLEDALASHAAEGSSSSTVKTTSRPSSTASLITREAEKAFVEETLLDLGYVPEDVERLANGKSGSLPSDGHSNSKLRSPSTDVAVESDGTDEADTADKADVDRTIGTDEADTADKADVDLTMRQNGLRDDRPQTNSRTPYGAETGDSFYRAALRSMAEKRSGSKGEHRE